MWGIANWWILPSGEVTTGGPVTNWATPSSLYIYSHSKPSQPNHSQANIGQLSPVLPPSLPQLGRSFPLDCSPATELLSSPLSTEPAARRNELDLPGSQGQGNLFIYQARESSLVPAVFLTAQFLQKL